MQILTGIKKGQSTKLFISETKTNRLIIGLSWDPAQSKALSKVGKYENPNNNLDLMFKSIKDVGKAVLNTDKYVKNIASSAYDAFQLLKHSTYLKRSNKLVDNEGRDIDFTHYDLDLHAYIFDKDLNLLHELSPFVLDALDESGKAYHSGEDYSGMGGYDDERISIETKNLPSNYAHILFIVKSDSVHSFQDIPNAEIRLADGKTEQDVLKVQVGDSNKDHSAFIFAHIYKENNAWHLRNISEYADFDIEEEQLKEYIG